jgi:intracellular sulfur oxidation DsrE/DsrF family protein
MHKTKYLAATVILFLALINNAGVFAAQQKKVVLQLTDNTAQKQVLVLNVADNLLKNYGNNVQIEVVAFGPGLQLLFAESKHNQRVSQLAKSGVKFSACRNTAKKMEKVLGKQVELNKYAKETDGGAARIIELVEQGYILIRP